eukprot:1960512-Prymnesium_polylepis.2
MLPNVGSREPHHGLGAVLRLECLDVGQRGVPAAPIGVAEEVAQLHVVELKVAEPIQARAQPVHQVYHGQRVAPAPLADAKKLDE